MDKLIREQDVLDVINEAIRMGRFYCGKERTIEEIKAIPSAESYKGMTNREVFEILFPNVPYVSEIITDICGVSLFNDWWNNPYETHERSE